MLKTRIAVTSLLLVSILLLTSMLAIGNVKATDHLNVNWGHMLNPNQNQQSYDEFIKEGYVCTDITGWFINEPGWDSWNAYGQDTTSGNLQSTIVYRQQHDTWAHDFWVGDFHGNYETGYSYQWGWEYVPYWDGWEWIYVWEYVQDYFPDSNLQTIHYNFYGEGGGSNDPHDTNIYWWTNWPYSKQHFTFVWTCACGNAVLDPHNNNQYVYGYNDDLTLNGTGAVGMPLAWTSRSDLSINGYDYPDSSTYCYLGWNSTSLGISTYTGNAYYPDYEYFLFYFYSYLVYGTNHSIKSSLDYASSQIWNCNWRGEDNRLGYGTIFDGEWHWINIFGNGNMILP